jgi:hypothetical protein
MKNEMNQKNKYFKTSIFLLAGFVVATLAAFVTCCMMLNFFHKQVFEKKAYSILPEDFPDIENGWSSLYDLPQDSPARYALNEIARRNSWWAFNLLCGDWPGSDKDRQEAVEILEKLKKRIDVGLKWPYKTPPTFKIPYTKTVPEIDGDISESCWKQALSFRGDYPLGSVKKADDGSVWKIMWDKKCLYVAAYFPDAHIIPSDRPGHSYRGDSLEIFLMPSKRMKMYWEVDIGCDGDLYDATNCNNRHGGWASEPSVEMKDLKFKALKQKDGFTVEVAIPFSELPNYMLGNQPQAGEAIYFALLRTDKNTENGKVEFSSAFPLLYGGHNIFGHAEGKLKK